ncbi:ParB/RepB/Spo0J family partition protein [Pendulispora rubella]|uniref:ParB/RepB/Spo0J family partition protein n=1 Tax=Pendulispora rubella TaxID=2741070 RepID=A0ABZ2LCZ4_9BACT
MSEKSVSSDTKKRALGRGLDALLPVAQPPARGYGDKSVFLCALEKLSPQKGQPRKVFEKTALEELAASIKEHGLLEPLVVRRVDGSDRFEIIAGERRWRASQKAGLHEVLVVVKDVSPAAAFELALIENVQREDLNAIELAEALSRLVQEHGYTQESLAERLGKDRTTIANSLRLMKLPPRVRDQVIEGALTEGHARALLGVVDGPAIERLSEKVIRGRLSVRATEAMVRKEKDKEKALAGEPPANGKKAPDAAAPQVKSSSVRDLEARLTRRLGSKVEVRDVGNKGELAIPYADLDQLDRILEKLLGGD